MLRQREHPADLIEIDGKTVAAGDGDGRAVVPERDQGFCRAGRRVVVEHRILERPEGAARAGEGDVGQHQLEDTGGLRAGREHRLEAAGGIAVLRGDLGQVGLHRIGRHRRRAAHQHDLERVGVEIVHLGGKVLHELIELLVGRHVGWSLWMRGMLADARGLPRASGFKKQPPARGTAATDVRMPARSRASTLSP